MSTRRDKFTPPASPDVAEGQRVRINGGAYEGMHGEYVRAHPTNGWHYVRIPAPGLTDRFISPLVPGVEPAPLINRKRTP